MSDQGVPDPASRIVVHESRRAALAVRSAHGLASVALLAGSTMGVLLTEGVRRRQSWDAAADLLLAHGLVGLLLVPLLLVATARLRRGSRLATRWVAVREGRLHVALAHGEALDVAAASVTVAAPSAAARALAREEAEGRAGVPITLLLGRGLVRDRLHLALPEEEAAALLAALPLGPRAIDVGVRTLDAAGWSLTASYALATAAAFAITPVLRAVVPLAPGEGVGATDHAGWLLGVGLAAFWLAHGVLAWRASPRSRVLAGADGVRVTSARGVDVFIPYASMTRLERVRRGLRIHRADQAPVALRLGATGTLAIQEAAEVIAASAGRDGQLEAAAAAGSIAAPRSAREVRLLATRLAGEDYRIEALDAEQLAASMIDPTATTGTRVGAALALAHRGEEGKRVVQQRAAALADAGTRQVLEAIAEGEVDDGAIDQLLVRAAR